MLITLVSSEQKWLQRRVGTRPLVHQAPGVHLVEREGRVDKRERLRQVRVERTKDLPAGVLADGAHLVV